MDIEQAKIAIASKGSGDPTRLLELAARLQTDNQIGYARRVLETALGCASGAAGKDRLDIRLQLAVCTYKDPDLSLDDRLNTALGMVHDILEDYPGIAPKQRQAALGIAGAVHKQRWTVYGLKSAIEIALGFYLEAYKLGVELDAGYTAINAAFVLDLLADQERGPGGAPGAHFVQLRTQAEAIRIEVIAALARYHQDQYLGAQYWFAATLGEACLGTGRYAEAREWMRAAAGMEIKAWQLESTARQMAHLARLQARKEGRPETELERTEAWSVVEALVGGDTSAALSFFRGKVGVALSGGGFRASLYHIGVLAKLAELDMLRHVEVLSCVSGGSILGAYYYLELKHLLESTADQDITREHYIALVRRIEKNFLEGVQRNIRNRMLFGFGANLKTVFSRRPPTSERLGELYERELYARIPDGAGSGPRYLRDLMIQPFGSEDFRPRYDNWRRRSKVPVLVLNATTLNTCHNWQFTASYMGEPPARGIDSEIDANDRLRRVYHEDLPGEFGGLRLGHAVAASACVPGLFDPLMFDQLYESGYVARLVDGGVYDNQGVSSLLEQDCTVLIVSDASGQTGLEKTPHDSHLGVPSRANNILMARVREAQYQLLAHLRDSSILAGLLYVHLKKDLNAAPVDWIGCPDPSPPQANAVLTRYGIRKDVQRQLAAVRTDLDAFSDAEADALMLSGYAMTGSEFARSVRGFPVPENAETTWRFGALQAIAGYPGASPELTALKEALHAAQAQSFKAWRLSPALRTLAWAASLVTAALWIGVCARSWARPLLSTSVNLELSGRAVALLALAGALALFLKQYALPRWLRYRGHISQCAFSLLMCLVGWLILWMQVRWIDPVYLRSGPRYRRETDATEAGTTAAGTAA
jgi:predicted acylesterase/phospholipase RssA